MQRGLGEAEISDVLRACPSRVATSRRPYTSSRGCARTRCGTPASASGARAVARGGDPRAGRARCRAACRAAGRRRLRCTRAERANTLSAASGSPYGMSEAHRICSGGTSESRLSWSSGVQVELSKKMFSTLRASLPMPACATIAACARISEASGWRSATCPSSSGMPGGRPRPGVDEHRQAALVREREDGLELADR